MVLNYSKKTLMINKWVLFTISFSLFLVGCSQDEGDQPTVRKDAPMSITKAMLSGTETKSADVVLTSGSIGVFLIENSLNGYEGLNNVKYDYQSSVSAWTNDSPDRIYLDVPSATVYGYYPYSAANQDHTAIRMNSQFNDPANTQIDLCYTKTPSYPSWSSPTVNFELSHAYAKVTFNIKNVRYSGIGKVDNISIINTSIFREGHLNILTGIVTPSGPTTQSDPFSFNPEILSLPVYDATNESSIVSTSALLVPVETIDGDVTLSFTLDGVTRVTSGVEIPQGKLSAGKNYIISITIDFNGVINFSPVECLDWTAVSNLPVIHPHK